MTRDQKIVLAVLIIGTAMVLIVGTTIVLVASAADSGELAASSTAAGEPATGSGQGSETPPAEVPASAAAEEERPAADEGDDDAREDAEATSVTATREVDGSRNTAVVPPPSILIIDFTAGEVMVRDDGNLELRAQNAPISFGEAATSPSTGPNKTSVLPPPRALATDSTACDADQIEYRRRDDGNIEVVTRDCTRITRW
jgi:hypothetical protein